MDCRRFREKHIGFVDDTLPAVEMEEMHRHLAWCGRCSRHDTAVRRGLMLVRSLPQVDVSDGFRAKLSERLVDARRLRDEERRLRHAPRRTRPINATYAALAAGLALAAYVAVDMLRHGGDPSELRLAPVIASAVEPAPPPLANPVYLAAVSTGMPVWPAVLMADQAPRHLANVELYQASAR